MAAASLLLLLDDIASALDDVSVMTQVAASKSAAVLGDDLALNAEQLTGVAADRELKVVWAVAKGSLRNKLVLVPTAILLATVIPAAILPLLMLGGLYLCFEGAEKLLARPHAPELPTAGRSERERIDGAVRTDFVLSAEILVIALGTLTHATLGQRVAVLFLVGLLMTVGVYGLVAFIVKLDDAGLYLSRRTPPAPWGFVTRLAGRALLGLAPRLLRLLAVVGTAAMFLVGGGLLVHGLPPLHAVAARTLGWATGAGLPPGLAAALTSLAVNAGTGLLTGLVAAAVVQGLQRVRARSG